MRGMKEVVRLSPELRPKAAVVCGGPEVPVAFLQRELEDVPFVVAADAGLDRLEKAGVRPNIWIGDADSVKSSLPAGVPALNLPRDKSMSDAEAAVELAVEHGGTPVFLLCALGGRFDHSLGNLAVAAKFPLSVFLRSPRSFTFVLPPSVGLKLMGWDGCTISLFPFGPSAAGVRTTGLRWNLRNEELKRSTRGLSNVVRQPSAAVASREGELIVTIIEREA